MIVIIKGDIMKYENEMKIEFSSKSQNESFARVVIASFVAQLDPTLEELSDIKTAVSEAVTNSIIHGYEEYDGQVYMYCKIIDNKVYIEIKDFGKGIGDINKAREPLFTSKPELERSGMGFTVMETFMDEVEVESKVGVGSKIIMRKKLESLEKL
jgi:stage II sporulation protein AB (anti-sigma F factor)